MYATIDVPYFGRYERNVVVVHDNPMFSFRGNLYSTRNRYRIIQRLRLLRHARTSNFIASSKFVRFGLCQWAIRNEPAVIYPPVNPAFRILPDRAEIRTRMRLPSNKRFVLSVSSTEPRKNLTTVEAVMNALGPEFQLIRVGAPLPGSISFRGLTVEDLVRVYNSADVLLFPTLMEGFGSPIAEAMASGLPVVASDIPIMREITWGAAILAPPMDVERLAEATRTAIERSSTLRDKGLERARIFTLSRFKSELGRYLEAIG
jgi:glycosyltransferase involved in cell wall biosynthesis